MGRAGAGSAGGHGSAPKEPGTGVRLSFEEALARLEAVVRELEQGELPLERALELFEEGVGLSRLLTATLEAAQARIDQVVGTPGGQVRLEPFVAGGLRAGESRTDEEE
ncbi:MAG: exodeoxyribonuclease VII small subunit [Firmicutes bacterium]|nr:exodeoxyribonuclease VII small subunit [Bacillota bacterium]